MTNYDRLSEPFPVDFIDRVNKGSHTEDYVNHAVVTDRLNRVLGEDGWTFEILHRETFNDDKGVPHCVGVTVRLTIGDIFRDEVGTVGRQSNYGDELKACVSDAVKRAAMRFGVGIQLWHKLPGDDEPSSPVPRGSVQNFDAPTANGDGEVTPQVAKLREVLGIYGDVSNVRQAWIEHIGKAKGEIKSPLPGRMSEEDLDTLLQHAPVA